MEPNIEARRAAALAASHELVRRSILRDQPLMECSAEGVANGTRARVTDDVPGDDEPRTVAEMLRQMRPAVARCNDAAMKRTFNRIARDHAVAPVPMDEPDDDDYNDLEGDAQSRREYARSRAKDSREYAQHSRERDLQRYYDACVPPPPERRRATDAAPRESDLAFYERCAAECTRLA